MTEDGGSRHTLLAAAAACVITAVALRAMSTVIPRPLLLVACIPLLLLAFHAQRTLSPMRRALTLGLAAGFLALLTLLAARIVWFSVANPPEWDFLGFWLNGRVAASGLNYYDPALASHLAVPYHPSAEFQREILDVGFWYPPPSIFLFLPLGFMTLHTAAAVWYASLVLVLGIDVFLLWRTFLPDTGPFGLIVTASLALGIFGTRSTFEFGQDNFLTLLALLLFWRGRDRLGGGVALAFGILVKPFLGGLFLYLLLRRRWRPVLGAAAGLALSAGVTLLAFGWAPFASYLDPAHYGRLPAWVYTEPSNQSLLATILRAGGAPVGPSPMTQPVFVGLVVLLTGITAWRIGRSAQDRDDWAAASAVLLALLVYPASQMFYCVLLVIPFLLLWKDRRLLPGGAPAVAVSVGVLYGLMDYRGGRHVFVATLALWLAAMALMAATRPREGSAGVEAKA
jgi:Glycosyltransferase family 87